MRTIRHRLQKQPSVPRATNLSAPSGADSLPRPKHFFPSTNLESSETEPTPATEPVADQATAVPPAAESLALNNANTSGPRHDASTLHEYINIEIDMAEGGAYIAADQNTSNPPLQAFSSSATLPVGLGRPGGGQSLTEAKERSLDVSVATWIGDLILTSMSFLKEVRGLL